MSNIICSGCPESDDIERPDGFSYAIITCPRCKGKGYEVSAYEGGSEYDDCPVCVAATDEASNHQFGFIALPLHPALVGIAWLEDYYADEHWSNGSQFVGCYSEGGDDEPTTLAPLRSLEDAQAALLVAGHALLLDWSRK